MKTSIKLACVALTIAISSMANISADEAEKKTCKCPVAGKELVVGGEHSSTTYKEATVYFCCNGCKGKFEAAQKKYAAKANKQLVATGQAKQVKCPITGRSVNPAQSVKIDSVEVGLCCGGCKGKANKAKGDAKIAMLFGDKAFKTGFEIVKK